MSPREIHRVPEGKQFEFGLPPSLRFQRKGFLHQIARPHSLADRRLKRE